ncbi:MAG: class I SAM-dependent methyltransferase [Bryobacteraceae bacterium]|jgi:2-polyprenyl-6-hydroxyphenyl methylase/3-demethylubiquinone-9 3-methyltransferase
MSARRDIATEHAEEVSAGERFEFGGNWASFLKVLDDERIASACKSLQSMLGVSDLNGKSFVDIGSGSGLFSLAARRLGARVHSFDYDTQSVACTAELKRRYYPGDTNWTVEQGSALDPDYLQSLGQFDIVYSWGVLHHTGAMWRALENIVSLAADGSVLFLSIYNDQGRQSRRWWKVKRNYNRLPPRLRFIVLWPAAWSMWRSHILRDFLRGKPFQTWREYKHRRGMSAWRDVVDWVGGFPFEVAKPEEIFSFYHQRGFELTRLQTQAGDLGCNEFVFLRTCRSSPRI